MRELADGATNVLRDLYAALVTRWWTSRQDGHPHPMVDRRNDQRLVLNRLARALRARGLGAGDAVALMCTNRPAFVETWAACLRAGFRITTINWHLTGEEAGYIVDDCEA